MTEHQYRINDIIYKHSPGNHVGPQGWHGLECLHELAELASLPRDEERDAKQESQDARDAELIADATQSVLQALGFHELLVLVPPHGGEAVGNAGADEGTPREVQFVDAREDYAANDNGEAEPLGLAHGLVVDVLGQHGREGCSSIRQMMANPSARNSE